MMSENSTLEYKSSFTDAVIESITAFANSKGGTILIGVDDNGTPVKSFTIGKENIPKWLNDIKNKTQPSIIPDIEIIKFKGALIIEIRVQEFPIKPVSFKGRYYVRVNNSNQQLTPIQIADISMQSLQLSWDSYPANNKTIEDIDFYKVEKFIQKVNDAGRFILEGNPVECLEKLKLIQNKKITNACYLLFAKGDIEYNIHLGRFKTESIIIDDKITRATLFEAVEIVMKYLLAQIKVAFEITGKTTQRTEIFEYPLSALRELVLNAVIHRDYTSPIDIQIKIFDNAINFFNPSGLYGNLHIDDLKTNNYRASTRNKLIAEAFYLTKDIEKYGSGFIRIRKAVSEYPTMNFLYKEIANGFLTELNYLSQKVDTNKFTDKITGNDTGNDTENDTGNDTGNRITRIIQLIKANKEITLKDLSNNLKISRITVIRDLEILKQQGKIKRIGPDKGGYWEVITRD